MAHEVEQHIFDSLAEQQIRRKLKIRSINALTNSVGALVRREMGWTLQESEKNRLGIAARSKKFVAAVMKTGAAPVGEDRALFDALAIDVEDCRLAIAPLVAARKRLEKQMRQTARALPVWDAFAAGVFGFGDLALAVVVAESNGLIQGHGVRKTYRRLGLAPWHGYSGKAWRVEKWRPRALTAAEWTEYGYSGRRLAEVYSCVYEPLVKAQKAANGPYRIVYEQRRARTAETHPDWTKMHSHFDGMRVMTKALIHDLHAVWNGNPVLYATQPLSAAD